MDRYYTRNLARATSERDIDSACLWNELKRGFLFLTHEDGRHYRYVTIGQGLADIVGWIIPAGTAEDMARSFLG